MENVRLEGRRLGRGPRIDDPRSFALSGLLPAGVPAAPPTLDLTAGVATWPMYANDAPLL